MIRHTLLMPMPSLFSSVLLLMPRAMLLFADAAVTILRRACHARAAPCAARRARRYARARAMLLQEGDVTRA